MESDKNSKNGDLFLIRFIKQKPIIYNTKHPDYHDREKRDRVFQKLSKLTNLDASFLKRRWITLRERYVKDLRCQVLKGSTLSNYTYNKELNFLKPHVKLKIKSNENLNHLETNFEFEITEEDLKMDDNDLNDVMIEFDDYILDDIPISNKSPANVKTEINQCKIITELNQVQVSTTMEEPQIFVVPEASCGKSQIIPVTPTLVPEPTIPLKATEDTSVRNEDVIFGELIVSQLMKITDESKKRSIKRSILDLFF